MEERWIGTTLSSTCVFYNALPFEDSQKYLSLPEKDREELRNRVNNFNLGRQSRLTVKMASLLVQDLYEAQRSSELAARDCRLGLVRD